jgi:redox-sensitive bicupin YhaK (pirin superfamily)
MTERRVALVRESVPTIEGAGVHLRRAFGHGDEKLFDPFLMMDDFRGDRPAQYERGFPWHPHRGIETITYMIAGECDHGDSVGNTGTICAGDVQWMTAGSGIMHQEMPRGDSEGRMGGFQLWANLPAVRKMRDPRYQGIQSVAVGAVADVAVEPEYLDVHLEADATWTHPTERGRTVFVYLFEGEGRFGRPGDPVSAGGGKVVLFDEGESVAVTAGPEGARFLLVSGRPLREPVAWRGPIVMNTSEELDEAWRELDEGTFVKHDGGR